MQNGPCGVVQPYLKDPSPLAENRQPSPSTRGVQKVKPPMYQNKPVIGIAYVALMNCTIGYILQQQSTSQSMDGVNASFFSVRCLGASSSIILYTLSLNYFISFPTDGSHRIMTNVGQDVVDFNVKDQLVLQLRVQALEERFQL